MCDEIGKRISCQDDFGTVKYSGSVTGFPGIWLGIDWDSELRGKHNGTVDGVQYFTASHPTSGSFVRHEKVNFGQTLAAAITTKYGSHYDLNRNHSQLISTQHAMKAPFIELVGFEKLNVYQSDFNNLKIVDCRLCNVKEVGDIRSICPNVTELNMSKNLINSWSNVFDICSQLPNLQMLNIGDNHLDKLKPLSNSFPNIVKLHCESMHLDWNDLLIISDLFPNLIGLYATANKVTSISVEEKTDKFANLEFLELISNSITSWKTVCQLTFLPKLKELNLGNINLDRIRFDDNDKIQWFPELTYLNIDRNHIEDWESIGQLNKIKSLANLKFLYNPILETESLATRDQIIVAKIESLKILNSHIITVGEREGAEYDYLKKYGTEWLSVKNTEKQDEFLKRHSRYSELMQKYGEIEKCLLTIQSTTITSNLLNLTLICDDKCIKKRLPPTMLVQKVATLAQRLFHLTDRPKLTYISARAPQTEFPLDDEYKEMDFYAVQEGDTILVKDNQ